MNSIPILYYTGEASHSIDEFRKFIWNTLNGWWDVEQLCLHCDLDEERWRIVQRHYKLPKSVLLKKRDKIDWGAVIEEYDCFTDEMVRELKDYVDFGHVVIFSRKVTEGCLREFVDRLDLHLVSKCRDLSIGFMEEFKDRLDWREITVRRINRRKIDDGFLERFADVVDWSLLSHYWSFSDSQLEKYGDWLDWTELSVWHRWNATTVAKYIDRIDWRMVLAYGNWFHRPSEMEKMKTEALRHVS